MCKSNKLMKAWKQGKSFVNGQVPKRRETSRSRWSCRAVHSLRETSPGLSPSFPRAFSAATMFAAESTTRKACSRYLAVPAPRFRSENRETEENQQPTHILKKPETSEMYCEALRSGQILLFPQQCYVSNSSLEVEPVTGWESVDTKPVIASYYKVSQ